MYYRLNGRGRRARKPQNRLFDTSCDGYVILRGKREIKAPRCKIRDIAHFEVLKKSPRDGLFI